MANELSMARPYVDVYGALEEGRQRAVARRQEEEANALSQAIRAASARAVRNGMVDPRLLGEELAQSGYAYAIPSAQEKLFATQKAAGEATKATSEGEQAQIKAIGDKMQSFRQRLPVNNPRLLPAWVEAVYADPDLGPFMSQFGTKEEVIAGIPQDPEGVAQWMEGASMAADEVMKRRTLTEQQRQDIDIRGRTARIQEQQARTAAAREARLGAAGTGAEGPPTKLKQGERWNAELQRVEAVPGSELFQKQKKVHGKDFDVVKSTAYETALGRGKIDKLLDPKNESEFNNLFGGYAAYATGRLPGKTATLRTELNSLKSNLKTAGKRIISAAGSGAIGQITEREWPILESMIGELVPEMDAPGARDKLTEIRSQLDKMENLARESYDETWGGSQYYANIPQSSAAPTAAPRPSADTGQVVNVRTVEEARALPKGTRFRTPDGRVKVR